MTDRTRNLIVGITAIVGLAGMGLLTTLFGYTSRLFEENYHVKIRFDETGGLTVGSRATYSGIDIGRVTDIQLIPPPDHGVIVTVLIREEISLPQTINVSVAAPLLGGSPKVAFTYVPPEEPQASITMVAKDGSVMLQGETSSMMGKLASQMTDALDGALDRVVGELDGPKQQLADLQVSLVSLSDEWTQVGQNINALVEMRSPDAVDAGEAEGNLASVLTRTDSRLAELEDTIASLNAWVNNEQMRDDLSQTMANAREMTGKLNEASGDLSQVIKDSGNNINNLSKRYVALADDLSKTVDSLNKAVTLAKDGKGTVGKLLNDPHLYDNINNDAERLGKALDELTLLIQQWREEGVPIKLFE